MRGTIHKARSFLFVPATRPDRFLKALATAADCVILDLEDAVGVEHKDAARQQLSEAFAAVGETDLQRVLVRVNAPGTLWHDEDLAMLSPWAKRGLAGAMVPKAEQPQALERALRILGGAAVLVPLIESVRGLRSIERLAAMPHVARLAFGHLDFQLDAGMRCTGDEAPLAPVRSELVLVSRLAALAAPVDGVTVATDDAEQLATDLTRSRQFGFGGKLCIHPAQVAAVNAAFVASPEELAWARRVLERARQHGGAAFSLDGRMVDAPLVSMARQLLDDVD